MSDFHALTAQRLIARLSAARKEHGWSQETLAVEARISSSCIQHLEHGRSTPTLITLLKLAAALKMDLPDLLRDAQVTQNQRIPKRAFGRRASGGTTD